jgi:hypothetical protein
MTLAQFDLLSEHFLEGVWRDTRSTSARITGVSGEIESAISRPRISSGAQSAGTFVRLLVFVIKLPAQLHDPEWATLRTHQTEVADESRPGKSQFYHTSISQNPCWTWYLKKTEPGNCMWCSSSQLTGLKYDLTTYIGVKYESTILWVHILCY